MESVLYSIWRVDVINLVRNKLYICKEYHIQPSEIDNLVYFEYEYMLEDINKEQKEQEKKNKDDEKKYAGLGRTPNYNSMMNNVGRSMPKLPNFSMPNL